MSGDPHLDSRVSPWLDSKTRRRGHGLADVDPEELRKGRWVGILTLLILIAMVVGLAVFILTAH